MIGVIDLASGNNQIPERLINFNVYGNDNTLYGMANITLPVIAAMTEVVKGAGIAGEVDSPVLGHFSSMTTTFTWRTIEKDALVLAQQKAHDIDVRGAQQVFDGASGEYNVTPVRLAMRVVPKTVTLGTFDPGVTTGTTQDFEVLYLKVFIDSKEVCEIDKYNYVAKFGNTDIADKIRGALGLN